MPAINDIQVSVSPAPSSASRVGFGVPLLVGFTGSRSVLITGSGVSGLVAKTINRQAVVSLEITVTGSSYTYNVAGTKVEWTVPAGALVREAVADFNSNAPSSVTNLISVEALTTGSGTLAAISETDLEFDTYQQIVDISQLQYYYDEDDKEYVITQNILASRPTPGQLYLLDVFEAAYVEEVSALIDAVDDGNWYMVHTTSTAEAEQQEISDWVNTKTKIALFTVLDSSAVSRLGTVQGYRTGYLVHDAPDDHPEASWSAKNLPNVPGQATWKHTQNLQGQTVNTTTTLSDLLAIRAAQGQAYTKKSGISFVNEGLLNDPNATSSNRTYIDQVWSRDWIEVNLQADLLELFTNAAAAGKKISYTDAGIAQVVGVIVRRLQLAAANGIIAPVETTEQAELSSDGQFRFRVTAPTRAEVEASNLSDITSRVLNNVEFSYVEAGAVHEVTVTGRVVLTE